ncbi:placenta-specific gene 8 protein-like [Mytilus galloprovincialis]|uniref:placenta-specific gene 8 protein-like n=1 Tax=Mytilus galloprovincialis TaxID=29158 RepID=UPI003F7C8C9C
MEALPTSYRSYGSNDFEVSPERPPPQMQPYKITTSNVTVVVNQPTLQHDQLMGTTTLDGHRTWSTGLFDCFSDMANCVFTCCCYPFAVCNLASRLGECFCAPACVPGGDIILRNRIRSVGGIKGSMCDDCLVIVCCGPCAACQEARELTNMGIP